jgi:hypothetical protein
VKSAPNPKPKKCVNLQAAGDTHHKARCLLSSRCQKLTSPYHIQFGWENGISEHYFKTIGAAHLAHALGIKINVRALRKMLIFDLETFAQYA